MTPTNNQRLGIVTGGSLTRGVEVRLDSSASVEDMVVGRYVTIYGRKQCFLGMITDISLGVVDPWLTITPPDISDSFVAEVLTGTSTYGTLQVTPYQVIGGQADARTKGSQPVKTIPSHFSEVKLASQDEFEQVFGKEDEERFHIGNPLDMEIKLCLNMERFVERSSGIFGKSGTGKTFFTRQLLIGMLQKSKAVNLIFDMHSEYGWKGTDEGKQRFVKGLKQLFPSQVAVFALDEKSSLRKGLTPDFVVRIGYDEIEPAVMALLRQTLNLTEPAVNAVYELHRRFGKNWLKNTLALKGVDETKDLLGELSIHESTFQNLKRGLAKLSRLGFLQPQASGDTVGRILGYLEQGKNVVLEFGRYQDITSYMLVANLLSRRIYDRYQERVEVAMAEDSAKPTPLVISIEEAHKFLNPEVASQTIFGRIAREMRKYNVTLLVIDQRPSGIDDEVMSQLGSKIAFSLDNDRDIDSVLSGVSGKGELKTVLAKLASKQQALIFGYAVPMPVSFKPCDYNETYYRRFTPSKTDITKQAEQDIEELWG